MLENSYYYKEIQNFFNQQVAQNLLFQVRYDSLFNSKKWQSDSSNSFGIPTFWPSHSVKLLNFLPNYYFSNLDCSGLEWQNFLKLDLLISKWSKFNNWPIFFEILTDLVYFRSHQTLCYFVAFWSVPASTKWPLHFGLSLSHLLLDIRVSYTHLKRILMAFRWPQLLEYIWCNYRARACVNFSVGSPSYVALPQQWCIIRKPDVNP